MKSGWLGDHYPRDLPKEPQAFWSEISHAIGRYRAGREQKSDWVEKRSAERYLAAVVAGKRPRNELPADYAALFRSHMAGYNDELKAAESILRAMTEQTAGRPESLSDDWLIAQAAITYRRYFGAGVGIGKHSKFADDFLSIILQAAGISALHIPTTRIRRAVDRFQSRNG